MSEKNWVLSIRWVLGVMTILSRFSLICALSVRLKCLSDVPVKLSGKRRQKLNVKKFITLLLIDAER